MTRIGGLESEWRRYIGLPPCPCPGCQSSADGPRDNLSVMERIRAHDAYRALAGHDPGDEDRSER